MQGANYPCRRIAPFVEQSVERRHELSDMRGSFRFVLEEVNDFEARMVIDKHEQVLKSCALCPHEWPSDVRVNTATWSAQPLKCPCESERGASAVMEGNARGQLAPAWSRLCMHAIALLGDMTST
eukprot:6200100-Pleurochrysis_carterae.AAC.5